MSCTHPVGITWLAPVVGAIFLRNARDEGKGFRAVLVWLTAYALASRGAVALLMVVASTWRLGSHYDLSRVTDVSFWGDVHWFVPGSFSRSCTSACCPSSPSGSPTPCWPASWGRACAAALWSARRGTGMRVMSPDLARD